MRSIIISIFVSLLPATTVVAFLPAQVQRPRSQTWEATSKPDMDGTIDITHAKYCADHFGECSLDEIDRIRNGKCVWFGCWMVLFCIAISTIHILCIKICFIIHTIDTALHQERVSHMFTNTDGLQNPHGLEEDVEHKVLENTLTLQMGLLKDQIATEENTSATMNPYTATLNLPVLDGGLDEESSEALMVCLAIAGMAILPQILGN